MPMEQIQRTRWVIRSHTTVIFSGSSRGKDLMQWAGRRALRSAIFAAAIVAAVDFCVLELGGRPAGRPSNPSELRAKNHTLSLTLHAGIASDGKNSFYFNGQPNAPTLRVSPGDQLKISYVNDLPTKAKESCAITPCMDMTNLHFHGLTVSPD